MENEKYTYEVWALGYDPLEEPTDAEVFLGDFETPDKAIEFAKKFETIEDVLAHAKENYESIYDFNPDEGDYFEIRVEKCIEFEPEDDLDPEEGYTECIDILYDKDVYLEEDDD